MIYMQGIQKDYFIGKRQLQILRDIDLHIAKGEMVAIMGASGSGKTTLLNVIGCLDRPTSGIYQLDGKEISRLSNRELAAIRGRKIGFIFQTFNLLPYLSAQANVELGMRYAGGSNSRTTLDCLSKVGLAERIRHRPGELSGGEQQRVAIARAIAKNPPLILADEPTGNLDSRSGAEIISILTELHSQQGLTLIIVTHDINIALQCQRIINIKDGQIVEESR